MTKQTTSLRKRPEQSYGTISIDGETIIWNYADVTNEIFKLSDIVIIGEQTNSNGPWFDDWFLIFVTENGNWFQIPWYANNIEELTKILCDKFQLDFNVSFLTTSTQWASVIRYPIHLKNKPLFKLIPSKNHKEPKTIIDKLLRSLGFGSFDAIKDVVLTDEVKEELTKTDYRY